MRLARAVHRVHGRARPPLRAREDGPSLRGDISRDLSPNDLIGFSTNLRCLLWFLLDSARTALTGGRHAESAAVRFLPNTALSLRHHCATTAPSPVFCHVDHLDRSQLHSDWAEVEILAAGAGQS